LAVIAVLLVAALAAGCGSTAGEALPDLAVVQQRAIATAHTTRLPASDPETQAIVIAQTVYAATQEENAVGAIILAPQDAATAFTAMNRVTHMPINAPLLYLDQQGRISQRTLREMHRLNPAGVPHDDFVQVYLIGATEPSVRQRIESELGYKVRQFPAADPIALSELLDRWQAALKSDHPDEVVISALDHPDGIGHGMGAMGWNAHMGRGFAWVRRDSVPEETRRLLSRRFGGAYMYLTGSPDVISDTVARELARYGFVRRVYGADVYASNAVNAGYKGFGRNFGWWWGWEARDFGWGISQAGHNFIIGSTVDLLSVIPAAVLGHMGKHGPLLLIERDRVPPSVVRYLDMVRPFESGPTETIFNHAWIIGDESRISWEAQRAIERLMRRSKLDPRVAHAPTSGE
jgi:hypothetical protein